MVRKRSTPPKQLSHHWYLREWAELYKFRQADAMRDLGWAKATASALWNGDQRYTQDLIDEVSIRFNIAPHELLMHPADAMALRQVREGAIRVAAIEGQTIPEKTGTKG